METRDGKECNAKVLRQIRLEPDDYVALTEIALEVSHKSGARVSWSEVMRRAAKDYIRDYRISLSEKGKKVSKNPQKEIKKMEILNVEDADAEVVEIDGEVVSDVLGHVRVDDIESQDAADLIGSGHLVICYDPDDQCDYVWGDSALISWIQELEGEYLEYQWKRKEFISDLEKLDLDDETYVEKRLAQIEQNFPKEEIERYQILISRIEEQYNDEGCLEP